MGKRAFKVGNFILIAHSKVSTNGKRNLHKTHSKSGQSKSTATQSTATQNTVQTRIGIYQQILPNNKATDYLIKLKILIKTLPMKF
jgi:hypothetical protein